jgi:hypothetical protein
MLGKRIDLDDSEPNGANTYRDMLSSGWVYRVVLRLPFCSYRTLPLTLNGNAVVRALMARTHPVLLMGVTVFLLTEKACNQPFLYIRSEARQAVGAWEAKAGAKLLPTEANFTWQFLFPKGAILKCGPTVGMLVSRR